MRAPVHQVDTIISPPLRRGAWMHAMVYWSQLHQSALSEKISAERDDIFHGSFDFVNMDSSLPPMHLMTAIFALCDSEKFIRTYNRFITFWPFCRPKGGSHKGYPIDGIF